MPNIATVGPITNLNSYLRYVNNIPSLPKEEEHDLINRYQTNNDLAAAQKLVLSNLKYVYFTVKDFIKFPLPIEDMIQEGNIALFTSIKKFNLSFDVKFFVFAAHHVKQAIQTYIFSNMNIMKQFTTKPMRKLFNNSFRFDWANNTVDYINHISEELDVPVRDVRRYKVIKEQTCIDVYDVDAYNLSQDMNEGIVTYETPLTKLMDEEQTIDSLNARQMLDILDERSKDIIINRLLVEDKMTLQQLSDKYNVSRERIRQLEAIALGKLKQNITDLVK